MQNKYIFTIFSNKKKRATEMVVRFVTPLGLKPRTFRTGI